jgi:hypothetical protein
MAILGLSPQQLSINKEKRGCALYGNTRGIKADLGKWVFPAAC